VRMGGECTSSGCLMAGFSISSVEPLSSATTMLIISYINIKKGNLKHCI
jgi:hypothetical protein